VGIHDAWKGGTVMGKRITTRCRGDLVGLKMGSACSDTFFAVLALNSSALATTLWRRGMALWLAERDQTVKGIGANSCDVADMPWTPFSFRFEHDVLLAVIADAITGERWAHLIRAGAERRHDVIDYPAKIGNMIERFRVQHISSERRTGWRMPANEVLDAVERCPIHGVVLHAGTPGIVAQDRAWGDRCIVCTWDDALLV
jgi:hypothetical protein